MKRSLQGDSCRLYYLGHPGIVSLDRFGKSLRGTAVLVLPLLFSLIWTLGLLKIFGIKLSWYNLVAFPAMLAFGINNGGADSF